MTGGALALAGSALRLRADVGSARAAQVCVYGGTAAGVMAALAAVRAGCSVILVEPSRWLGGMTGGGIDAIDWGNKNAVGGTAARILRDKGTDPEYRRIFLDLVKEHAITVIYEHRLASVKREGATIRSIALDHAPPDKTGCPPAEAKTAGAMEVAARVFIDCSYEGDLMAKAGVSYTFGRESAEQYGESLAGTRPPLEVYAIDPYVKPGDTKSGLIPLVQDVQIGPPGSADKLTMMYCWRWKLTNDEQRIPFGEPEEYDPRRFEIFRRGFQAGVDMTRGRHMRKLGAYEACGGSFYGANSSRALIAQSMAGWSADYPDGDWKTRARIWKFHQEFVRGVTRFLKTDPVVPEKWRTKAAIIGLKPGYFDDTGGWPHQLYVREARRMTSSYVVTQKDLEGATNPDDAIGLASYGVDDWPYATHALDGKIAINGGEFSILRLDHEHAGIYQIPYRAITPLEKECDNLLVPVCVSASHIAMTSIRMEPVWMILGESAGTAAAHALAEKTAVQTIDVPRLRRALRAAGQLLERDRVTPSGAWTSREAWNRDKPGYEWLFDHVDGDRDGTISGDEYRAFRDFKQRHADWETQIKGGRYAP